jgi:flagellar hook protein FlgE
MDMMSLSAITNAALSGMQAQTTRLSATADNLANLDTANFAARETDFASMDGGGVSASVSSSGASVGPTREITAMLEARSAFAANAAAFEAGADLWDALRAIKRD